MSEWWCREGARRREGLPSYAAFGFVSTIWKAVLLHGRPSSNLSVLLAILSAFAQAHPRRQSLVQQRSSQSLPS